MIINSKDDNLQNKQNLYLNVQNIIKDVKVNKYFKESEDIAKEGISFWGTITGKNSLQLEKIKNLKLKVKLLEVSKPKLKNEYVIKDLMADLYACAIVDLSGKFTDEMSNLYNEMKLQCDENDEELEREIYKLATKKISESKKYLPIIHEEKTNGIFIANRTQTKLLRIENQNIKKQIELEGENINFSFI